MGRNWLKVVRLDWREIGKVSVITANVESHVAALQEQYQEVFSESLGTITPYQTKLSVMLNAQPNFSNQGLSLMLYMNGLRAS